MKNKIFLLGAIILMCCPMVYGCSSSDSETDSSSSSNYSSSSSSWDKTINEVYDLALDEDTYPFADEIYINVSDEKKLVDYTVIVANDTTSEEAVQYASDLITMFNDVASNSDDSITKSSDGNYGSLFDEYDVLMTIATEESVLNEKDWLVCQTIKAGEHTPIEAGGFSEDEE